MPKPVTDVQRATAEQVAKALPNARVPLPSPLRGTQSFVAVFGRVWRRPGLLAIELLWRWSVGIPLIWLAWRAASRALAGSLGSLSSLGNIDLLLRPAEAFAAISRELEILLPPLQPSLHWFVPLAIVLWTMASSLGRTCIWRRLDATLRPQYALAASLGLVRSLALLGTLAAWLWGTATAAEVAISRPAAAGEEPNLVLFTALAVGLTLLLFLLWAVTSWVLDAAPLFAMDTRANKPGERGPGFAWSLGRAFHARALRSKLIETNLVLGIVKVALLVLAMVFSASPLPFVSEETPAFLRTWWTFVGALFLVSLDLFHVVRRAAYLHLFRALTAPEAAVKTEADMTPEADTTFGTRAAS